jgi:hypothetical protein
MLNDAKIDTLIKQILDNLPSELTQIKQDLEKISGQPLLPVLPGWILSLVRNLIFKPNCWHVRVYYWKKWRKK